MLDVTGGIDVIIVRIRGGLGNQFFSYARGYALAKKNNVDLKLDDFIYNTSYGLRQFKLLDYNISYSKMFITGFQTENKFEKTLLKIWNRIKWQVLYHCIYIKEKKGFEYQEIPILKEKNYYLNGYWQVHEYFSDYREDLKKELQLKKVSPELLKLADKIRHGKYCAIHVRRGDYKTFLGGKCLSAEYYKNAIAIIRKSVSNPRFLIFSDDLDFCKKEFGCLENLEFCESEKWSDEEELFLMSCCDSFIIANSTFSWWAAYLSEKNTPIVICPVVDMWEGNFYLDEWVKLDTKLEQVTDSEERT